MPTAIRSPARACSTCSPAPARSGSRRCRAARPSRCSSMTARRRARCCGRMSRRWASRRSTRIFRRDATKLGPAHPIEPFSLVFLDPPYGKGLAEKALTSARDGGWLTPDALIVVEEAVEAAFKAPEGFEEIERRDYDDTEFVDPQARVTSARTAARCRRASAPHRSGGRGCTGRSSASLPSRAAARSSPRP